MSKYSLQHTIRQGLNGLFHICKEELKMTVRDQGVLIFFLLVPLAYPLVYAFINNRKCTASSAYPKHSAVIWRAADRPVSASTPT